MTLKQFKSLKVGDLVTLTPKALRYEAESAYEANQIPGEGIREVNLESAAISLVIGYGAPYRAKVTGMLYRAELVAMIELTLLNSKGKPTKLSTNSFFEAKDLILVKRKS